MKFFDCCCCCCCCCCCWFNLWGVLNTTGTEGSWTLPLFATVVEPFPLAKGMATNCPATGARAPGALATRPKDWSICGVAARTVPCDCKNSQYLYITNDNYCKLTLDLSTALTAPEAIETGTPLAAVACTTFIIWGWPVQHHRNGQNV